MAREIALTRGLTAIVDDDDFLWLSQWKWHAHVTRRGHFYAARSARAGAARSMEYMHRLLAPAGELEVDHINGNKLDNRRANLRVVDRSTNTRNQHRKRSGCSSEHIGVHRTDDGRWRAQVTVRYKNINLGTFDALEDAVAARARGAALHYAGSP